MCSPPRKKGDTRDTILAIFMHTFAYLALSTILQEIESLAVVYFQATLEHNFHIMIGIQKPIVRDRSFLTFKLGGDGLKKSKSQDTQFFLLFFLFSSMYSIFPRHGNTKIFSCRSQSAKPQSIVKPDLRIEYHNTKYLAWIYVCQVTSYDDRHILELCMKQVSSNRP